MGNHWNVPLTKEEYEPLRSASAVLGWVLRTEYNGGDPKVSTCDCAAYLLKNNFISADREIILAVSSSAGPEMLKTSDVIIRSTDDTLRAKEGDTIPRKCHSKAICYIGENTVTAAERQTGGLGTIIDDACANAAGST
jgi:hypothetical protein